MNRAKYDDPDAPLQLLLESSDPLTFSRFLRSVVPSVLVNLVGAALLIGFIDSASQYEPAVGNLKKAIPLVAPRRLTLTQKDPNRAKVKNEITTSSARQPSAPKIRQFRPPVPATQATRPVQSNALPEPPQLQAGLSQPQVSGVLPTAPQTIERPKAAPGNPVPELPIKAPSDRPQIMAPVAAIPELPQPSSPGANRSIDGPSPVATPASSDTKAELLSDPLGADFKAYLSNLGNLVHTNWQRSLNLSARVALTIRRPGQVIVQCAIDRRGRITLLKVMEHANLAELDQAAKNSVSAPQPFPPLPADYKGDEILLNITLAYKPQ